MKTRTRKARLLRNCNPGQLRDATTGRCGPGIGIDLPRDQMPQIRSEDLERFVGWCQLQGVDVQRQTVPADSLSPIQREFRQERVDAMPLAKLGDPILVSRDRYVLGGTHRWVKSWQLHPQRSVRVYAIDLDLLPALELMRRFPQAKFVQNVGPEQLRGKDGRWIKYLSTTEALHEAFKHHGYHSAKEAGLLDKAVQGGIKRGRKGIIEACIKQDISPVNAVKIADYAELIRTESFEQTENALTVNPFVSEAQRRACYAADDPRWDCEEWSAATKGKSLPKRKSQKPVHNISVKKTARTASSKKRANVARMDPSRTLTERRAFCAKLHVQFSGLKAAVLRLFGKDDVLGLVGNANPNHDELGRFATSDEHVGKDRKAALASGFLYHGMDESHFQDYLKSEGFEGGGFSSTPIKGYGPRYLAIRQQDLPAPTFSQGGAAKTNVDYSFTGPHENLTPLRSGREAEVWGQLYAFPHHLTYEADEHGNILRRMGNPPATANTVFLQRTVRNAADWKPLSDPAKLQAFQDWLRQQLKARIQGQTQQQLWEAYVKAGFQKGTARSFDDYHKTRAAKASPQVLIGDQQKLDFYAGTKQQFLTDSFRHPETVEKAQLMASRTFDELENVTADMSNKMSRMLTDGLVQGKGPKEIADGMVDEVGFSEQRAMLVARTELIRAHSEGQLTALDNLGVEEVGVAVEWSTAGDDRVCPLCESLENIVLKIDEARGLIPHHPGCRCSWIPANVGEDGDGRKDTKRQIDVALEEGGLDPDEVDVDKDRPQSILNMNPNHDELGRFAAISLAVRKHPTGKDRLIAGVELDGEEVGRVHILTDLAPIATLDQLEVDKESSGKGVAKNLYRKVFEHLRSKGFSEVQSSENLKEGGEGVWQSLMRDDPSIKRRTDGVYCKPLQLADNERATSFLTSNDASCGIEGGRFQPGNTCAKGGAGTPEQLAHRFARAHENGTIEHVLGRLQHTAGHNLGDKQVSLVTDKWSLKANDAWLGHAIANGRRVRFAHPVKREDLHRDAYDHRSGKVSKVQTVLHREVKQLTRAGYTPHRDVHGNLIGMEPPKQPTKNEKWNEEERYIVLNEEPGRSGRDEELERQAAAGSVSHLRGFAAYAGDMKEPDLTEMAIGYLAQLNLLDEDDDRDLIAQVQRLRDEVGEDQFRDAWNAAWGEDGAAADLGDQFKQLVLTGLDDPTLNANPNHDQLGRFSHGDIDAERERLLEQINGGKLRGKELAKAHKERERLRQLKYAQPVTPQAEPSPEGKHSTDSLLAKLRQVDQSKGGYNLVHLGDLRAAHGDISKSQFDSLLLKARDEGKMSLSAAEGRHGISQHDRDSAVYETDTAGEPRALLYASVRHTHNMNPNHDEKGQFSSSNELHSIAVSAIRELTAKYGEDQGPEKGLSPQEINEGYCSWFAHAAVRLIQQKRGREVTVAGNANETEDVHTSRTNMDEDGEGHMWVTVDGRHYDPEAPEGVDDPRQLPWFNRHKGFHVLSK